MDDSTIQYLEKIIYKKILCYSELQRCFEKERQALIDLDIEALWEISKEKETLCTKIEQLRRELSSTLVGSEDGAFVSLREIIEIIPVDKRSQFRKLNHTLNRYKSEIDMIRKENKTHIEDSLQFLDEMISLITGEVEPHVLYNNKSRLNKSSNRMVLSREV